MHSFQSIATNLKRILFRDKISYFDRNRIQPLYPFYGSSLCWFHQSYNGFGCYLYFGSWLWLRKWRQRFKHNKRHSWFQRHGIVDSFYHQRIGHGRVGSSIFLQPMFHIVGGNHLRRIYWIGKGKATKN